MLVEGTHPLASTPLEMGPTVPACPSTGQGPGSGEQPAPFLPEALGTLGHQLGLEEPWEGQRGQWLTWQDLFFNGREVALLKSSQTWPWSGESWGRQPLGLAHCPVLFCPLCPSCSVPSCLHGVDPSAHPHSVARGRSRAQAEPWPQSHPVPGAGWFSGGNCPHALAPWRKASCASGVAADAGARETEARGTGWWARHPQRSHVEKPHLWGLTPSVESGPGWTQQLRAQPHT